MIASALRVISLVVLLASCGSSEPVYVADSTRVSNPRYAEPTGYPRALPAGYVESCPEQEDTVTVTGTGTEASSPCPAPASTAADRDTLLELAQPRAGDPRGGPEILATYTGRASYYSDRLAGRRTANGERYDPTMLTAASRDLPFDTLVRITRIDNGETVIVRVNDRGPFGDRRRILDLSRAAAERLHMIRAGVVEIRAEVIAQPED